MSTSQVTDVELWRNQIVNDSKSSWDAKRRYIRYLVENNGSLEDAIWLAEQIYRGDRSDWRILEDLERLFKKKFKDGTDSYSDWCKAMTKLDEMIPGDLRDQCYYIIEFYRWAKAKAEGMYVFCTEGNPFERLEEMVGEVVSYRYETHERMPYFDGQPTNRDGCYNQVHFSPNKIKFKAGALSPEFTEVILDDGKLISLSTTSCSYHNSMAFSADFKYVISAGSITGISYAKDPYYPVWQWSDDPAECGRLKMVIHPTEQGYSEILSPDNPEDAEKIKFDLKIDYLDLFNEIVSASDIRNFFHQLCTRIGWSKSYSLEREKSARAFIEGWRALHPKKDLSS